jgi:hypothetical protein
MGIFRKLFQALCLSRSPELKDVPFYANRLSKQMSNIAKVGLKIESYFPRVHQYCPNRYFVADALTAFRSVGGRPGDAALEIYRDIDENINTMKGFLDAWRNAYDIDLTLLSYAEDLYINLRKLREFIEDTPPDMMVSCKEIVIQKRNRC